MQGVIQSNTTSIPSAARLVSGNSGAIINRAFDNAAFYVDITAITGDTVTFDIEVQDPLSSAWISVLTSAALAAVGTTALQIGQDMVNVANLSARTLIPLNYRVRWTVGGAIATCTFSVGIVST